MKIIGISNQTKISSLIIIFFIFSFRLPQLFPPSLGLLISLSIALLIFVYTLFLALKNKFVIRNISIGKVLLIFAYLSLETIAFLRSGINGVLNLTSVIQFIGISVTLTFFMLFSISAMKTRDELSYFIRSIIFGFSLLLLINLLLYIFGINAYQTGNEYLYTTSKGVLLSSIGFEIPAAIYPLEAGPKSLGSILIFIGAISLMFIKNGKNQFFYFFLFAICSFMIVASDARFYFSIILLLIVAFPFYRLFLSRRFVEIYKFIFPIIPILLIIVATYISNIPGFEILSRNADDNISSLSGRTLIWNYIGENIMEINPEIIFGYGAAGTVNSGINNELIYLFDDGWQNTGIKTAHNILLQQLLDKGLIGVFIFIYLIMSIVNTFRENMSIESQALLLGTLTLMLASSLNTLFYYAHSESYILFLIIVGLHSSSILNKNN